MVGRINKLTRGPVDRSFHMTVQPGPVPSNNNNASLIGGCSPNILLSKFRGKKYCHTVYILESCPTACTAIRQGFGKLHWAQLLRPLPTMVTNRDCSFISRDVKYGGVKARTWRVTLEAVRWLPCDA